MPQGTLIDKFNNAPHPFIATFENDSCSKTSTPAILEDARRRTTAAAGKYLAIEPTPISRSSTSRNTDTAAAREGIASTGQPTTTHASAPSSSPSPTFAAPVLESLETSHNTDVARNTLQAGTPFNTTHRGAEGPNAPNGRDASTAFNTPRPRIALHKHATALLHDVADHPFTLCTMAYRRCVLLLAQGDRSRAQVERLGLLCATRVTCGRGRGKTGIALSLLAEAWRVLGRSPTKGLRGGSSVAHNHCVFELHRRIPGSLIEEYLGSKAVDLAIPFITELHEPFYRAITQLTGRASHLEDGDIIALEVEISAPSRSSVTNAEKDAAAGVALTVLAIADRQPERLALILPSNTVVVDVYALLDALRLTEER
jgi:hypothetical protein